LYYFYSLPLLDYKDESSIFKNFNRHLLEENIPS
jgi:hypothetical protein